jgi:hypothetical protein
MVERIIRQKAGTVFQNVRSETCPLFDENKVHITLLKAENKV